MWSQFESAVSAHGSFFTSESSLGLSFARFDVREPTTKPDCPSASGQVQIRSCKPLTSSRCLGDTPASRSMRQEPHPVRPFHCGRTTTSTIRMGRRIMAERRRRRTGPSRRNRGRAPAKDIEHRTNGADESLRVFIRALARQAARECFELEVKQRSRTIQ
jgi:hypothetical protein